jgi:hypothetical protein
LAASARFEPVLNLQRDLTETRSEGSNIVVLEDESTSIVESYGLLTARRAHTLESNNIASSRVHSSAPLWAEQMSKLVQMPAYVVDALLF